MGNIWDNQGFLVACEEKRDKHRKDIGRLTFDCFQAKAREDRVVCAKGFTLGNVKDGSMFLIAVLKGRTSAQCKRCAEFDSEEITQ